MSQHDFNIANQTFPNFRADLNNALVAAATMSAGSSAPTTPYAYQLWFDTTTGTWKVRNSGNTAWINTITTDLATGNLDVTGRVTADDLDLSVGTAGDGIQITSAGANYLNLGFDTNRTGASQTLTQIEQKWNGTAVARIQFVSGSDTTNKDDAEIRFQTASAGTPSTRTTISSAGILRTQCTAGSGNYAFEAYNPTSTSSRAIALFQSNVGGTQANKVVIQCDGSVGIGTSSINNTLEIKSPTASDGIRLSNAVGSYYHLVRSNGDGLLFDADAGNTGGAGADIRFQVKGSEKMRLESDGDLQVDGDVIAFSTTISDERLKTDITKIGSALDKVKQLNGYTFTYKSDGKQSAGVIAQEVEKVLPSAVAEKQLPLKTDDEVSYKTVQYDQLVGLLIEAVNELQAKVAKLEEK